MVYSSGKNLVYAFHNYKPYTLNSPLYLGVPAIAVGLSAISLLAFCFLLTQKICTPIPFPVSCTQIPFPLAHSGYGLGTSTGSVTSSPSPKLSPETLAKDAAPIPNALR